MAGLERLASRNSSNSAFPPSRDDQPGRKAPQGKGMLWHGARHYLATRWSAGEGSRVSSYVEAETADMAGGPGGPVPTARDDVTGAVATLFRDHHLELVRLALLLVGDLATAEDVVQDAFERLHGHWHGLRDPGNGFAYVRSSVLNGCRSAHRRAAVRRKIFSRLTEPPDAAADAAVAAADCDALAVALRGLPPRQREVLVLRYYADLDPAEIAATLRISQGSVRATTSRGLATLARALAEEPYR